VVGLIGSIGRDYCSQSRAAGIGVDVSGRNSDRASRTKAFNVQNCFFPRSEHEQSATVFLARVSFQDTSAATDGS
jgi:hypothetical protein